MRYRATHNTHTCTAFVKKTKSTTPTHITGIWKILLAKSECKHYMTTQVIKYLYQKEPDDGETGDGGEEILSEANNGTSEYPSGCGSKLGLA